MKSLNSFTDLSMTKGLLLLAGEEIKTEVETHMLVYLKVEAGDNKTVSIAPLMRYLFEKMDIKGDDLKIAFCAVCFNDEDFYRLRATYRHNESAIEKRLIPKFDERYFGELSYTSKERQEESRKEIEEMFKDNEISPFDDIVC